MTESDFRKRFGRAVAAARGARELSQEQLAELVETSRNEISLVERGQVSCSVWIAFRIAAALDLGLDVLAARARKAPSSGELRFAEVARTIPVSELARATAILEATFGEPVVKPKRYVRTKTTR